MNAEGATSRRLGIVGAGKLGTTIARAAMDAGWNVAISGSGAPERIALIVDVLAPGARVMTTDEVARFAPLVVLALPAHRFKELSRDLFRDVILIDAMNYWEEIDGTNDELATAPRGTSALVQEWFSSARVVKSFNQLGYHDLDERQLPRGAGERVALGVAGDDPHAVEEVARLVDELGFEPLKVGSLAEGVALEPSGIAFGVALGANELARRLREVADVESYDNSGLGVVSSPR